MKAKDVMKTLRISRPTLCKWVKLGKIRYKQLPSGFYDYLDSDVYNLLSGDVKRKTVIYARVSTANQRDSLESQVSTLNQFCFMNGYTVGAIYKDIASGIDFSNRKEFFELLDDLFDNKIERVVVSYKDRLSRIAFSFFEKLFKHFGCEIVVMSELNNIKLESEEVFDEIISLLHCYSMKLYSKRNKDKNSIEVSMNDSRTS